MKTSDNEHLVVWSEDNATYGKGTTLVNKDSFPNFQAMSNEFNYSSWTRWVVTLPSRSSLSHSLLLAQGTVILRNTTHPFTVLLPAYLSVPLNSSTVYNEFLRLLPHHSDDSCFLSEESFLDPQSEDPLSLQWHLSALIIKAQLLKFLGEILEFNLVTWKE